MARAMGFFSVFAALFLVAWLSLRSSKPSHSVASAPSGPASGHLGEMPPDEIMRDPAAAKKYVQGQHCSGACEHTMQTCIGLASSDSAEQKCREDRKVCEDSCTNSGAPTP